MMNSRPADFTATAPSLRPVAILVFATKLMVAGFLIAQVTMLPPSPVAEVYGLAR